MSIYEASQHRKNILKVHENKRVQFAKKCGTPSGIDNGKNGLCKHIQEEGGFKKIKKSIKLTYNRSTPHPPTPRPKKRKKALPHPKFQQKDCKIS